MSDYLKKRQEHILNDRPLPEKKKNKIKPVSDKRAAKIAAAKNAKTDDSLDAWFERKMATSKPVCAECGMEAYWLLEPQEDPKKAEAYRLMWRACQAHILPKKKNYGFPSLATNDDNHIVLFPSWGGHLCGDHGFYDSNWYNATTMKIWPKVVEAFKKLYPLIPHDERKNIPEQLLKEIE